MIYTSMIARLGLCTTAVLLYRVSHFRTPHARGSTLLNSGSRYIGQVISITYTPDRVSRVNHMLSVPA